MFLDKCQVVSRSNVLMMGVSHDLRVMWGIVVPKNALSLANVGVGVMHPDRITQLGANHFIEVEVRTVPENDPAPDESIIVIRCQAGDWFLDFTNPDVLSQATFDVRKIVVNDHAATGSRCMNWRIGSEVK